MEMKPVDSSNVVAIGYENETLCVRFRDGAEDLMAAPSKGKALNGLIALRAGVTLRSKPDKSAVLKQGGPIHTSQAEGCCRKHINNASLSGTLDKLEPWECPKCGTRYEPKAHGPLVNWEASADVLVFRI